MADSSATDFYAAMRATLERDVDVSPGFARGCMRYELERLADS